MEPKGFLLSKYFVKLYLIPFCFYTGDITVFILSQSCCAVIHSGDYSLCADKIFLTLKTYKLLSY